MKTKKQDPTPEEIIRVLEHLDEYWTDTTTIHYCLGIYKGVENIRRKQK